MARPKSLVTPFYSSSFAYLKYLSTLRFWTRKSQPIQLSHSIHSTYQPVREEEQHMFKQKDESCFSNPIIHRPQLCLRDTFVDVKHGYIPFRINHWYIPVMQEIYVRVLSLHIYFLWFCPKMCASFFQQLHRRYTYETLNLPFFLSKYAAFNILNQAKQRITINCSASSTVFSIYFLLSFNRNLFLLNCHSFSCVPTSFSFFLPIDRPDYKLISV